MFMSLALLQLASSLSTKRDPGVAPPSWSADAKKAFDISCTVLAREDLNYWIHLVPQRYYRIYWQVSGLSGRRGRKLVISTNFSRNMPIF